MDVIRALQQAAPAITSSLRDTAAPPLADTPEVSVQDAQSVLMTTTENELACPNAQGMSGGVSHFLDADRFLFRLKQLVCSTEELCNRVGRKREKGAIHGFRTHEKVPFPRHSSSGGQGETAGEERDVSVKLSLPYLQDSDSDLHEIDKVCIREDLRRIYASIEESISATAFCVATLEIYQSQPTLLDAHLVSIVTPLSDTVARHLDLVTPLLISDLQAKVSVILSQLSQSVPTRYSFGPSEPSSASVPSSFSCSPCSTSLSLPATSCSVFASSSAASRTPESCCSSSCHSLFSEKNSNSSANCEQSSLSASLPQANYRKPESTCTGMPHSHLVSSPESHCPSNGNEWRLVKQLEDLYLRIAASLALRLLMHLLYVVSRVRGSKHMRQLLPSEPELLEVLVDHCEQLLDSEFSQALRPAPGTATCLTNSTGIFPTFMVIDAPTTDKELLHGQGCRGCRELVINSRGLAREGACGKRAERRNKCLMCIVSTLVQHMRNLLDLLQQLPLWSTHYYLLVWLSLLVLAPFDLDSLDSSSSAASHTQQQSAEASIALPARGQQEQKTHERMHAADDLAQVILQETRGEKDSERHRQSPLGFRIIVLVEGYLQRTSSKASDAAAFVVARFLSRPNVGTKTAGAFSAFLRFCQSMLDNVDSDAVIRARSHAALPYPSDQVPSSILRNTTDPIPLFAKTNALRAVNEILKNISREAALPELPRLLHLLSIRREHSQQEISHQEIIGEAQNTGEVPTGGGLENAAKSALFRKLRCSCAARICMLLLPPLGSDAYQWRYTAHARDLEAHLKQSQQQMLQQQSTHVGDRESTVDSTTEVEERNKFQHDAHEEDVPEAVEEVINLLLESLADRDTIVRWAAAKAIGRVVLQLPQSFASQVVDSILESMEVDTSYRGTSAERLWHGSCLALGELLRRGLVNPEKHLHALATRLCYALSLDTSDRVGHADSSSYMTTTANAEQLRDAACFALWSLARANYDRSETVKQHIKPLSEALLLVALFDREVNCRRAAAAAFQELEGRRGGIRHGLQIVTTADFYALATRRSSYLKVAPQVAALDHSYCALLLNTLMTLLLQQTDEEMRTLAAAAIKRIAGLRDISAIQKDMNFLLTKAAAERENLTTRQGALLGLTALLEALEIFVAKQSIERATAASKKTDFTREGALVTETVTIPRREMCSPSLRRINTIGKNCDQPYPSASVTETSCLAAHCNGEARPVRKENFSLLEEKLQTLLRQLVITIEKQRLYRGKGGDMIRTAVCRFIQALATSTCIIFKRATARRYMTTLMEGFRHFSDNVQLAAAEALRALLRLRLSREEIEWEIVPELLQRLQDPSENIAARRGYTLALATLPEDVYRSICSSSIQPQKRYHVPCVDLLGYLLTESVSFAPLGRRSLRDAQTRRNALIALAFALRALLALPGKSGYTAPGQRGKGALTAVGPTNSVLERSMEAAEIHSSQKDISGMLRCEGDKALERTCLPHCATTAVATAAPPTFSRAAAGDSCCRSVAGATTQSPHSTALSAKAVEADFLFQLAGEENPVECTPTSSTDAVTEGCTSKYVSKMLHAFLESICSTLETCSLDYQVDRRGDVGSWVREVAAEVAAFLLENPRISCRSCNCTSQTKTSGQAALTDNQAAEVVDLKYVCDEGQKCLKARLFSLLVRLSLESLDRTRSRAVFLLYHLVAPLPTSCFRTLSAKAFKVECIWSRVFYDFSYEAVSANLIPRADLLRAGISPCLAIPLTGQVGEQQPPLAAAVVKATGATEVTSASIPAALRATAKGCGLLVAMLQHILVPLAEEQINALESVKPQVPFHNLNLSEFAVVNGCCRFVSATGSTGETCQMVAHTTGVPVNENTISRRRDAAVGGSEDTALTVPETMFSSDPGFDAENMIKSLNEIEQHANSLENNQVVDNANHMDAAFEDNKSSFDFLLEVSVGDGGRASLHRTRKAGVLLRLPLFTNPAITYPRLLLSLLTPAPFSNAAAQGLCLGVAALAGGTSYRAAQALLEFLTNLRHADDAQKRECAASTVNEAKQGSTLDLQLFESTQATRSYPSRLILTAASEQQKAVADALLEVEGATLLHKGEAAVHRIGSLIVNVLEESASEPARDTPTGVHRSDLQSEKMRLAALKTVTLISGFLSNNENLLLKTLDDEIWRRSYQYAKARCEALIALLSAAWTSTPRGYLYNGITNATAGNSAAGSQKVYKKAFCAVLQYLTHSFPKLRQLAAEELYASVLLPLSAIHEKWKDDQKLNHTDFAAPADNAETPARSNVNAPGNTPLFAHISGLVEDASQVVIGTPWMEICVSDTDSVEKLVDLFGVRVEWKEITDQKRHK